MESRKKTPWEDPCLEGKEVAVVVLAEMEKCRIESVTELSERSGIPYEVLLGLITMEIPFYDEKKGKWERPAVELADFFGSLPWDLFSEENRDLVLQEIQTSVEIFSISGTQRSPEEIAAERERLTVLSDRERSILAGHLGLQSGKRMTFKMMGRKMGISGERVRFIEERALRKLKNPRHLRVISKKR